MSKNIFPALTVLFTGGKRRNPPFQWDIKTRFHLKKDRFRGKGSFIEKAAAIPVNAFGRPYSEGPCLDDHPMNPYHADIAVPGYTITAQFQERNRTCIYRGRRNCDRRPVLLKAPLAGGPASEAAGAIRREYHILLHLAGIPGICRVVELGYHRNLPVLILADPGCRPLTEGNRTGLTLEARLGIGIRIADLLEAVHDRGIVHGDLNPANLLVDPAGGAIFLLNFDAAACPVTVFPSENGPIQAADPAYRSPEAFGRMDCMPDWRSDFYSLGVLLYELMTGRRPFDAADPADLIYAHMARRPDPPLVWACDGTPAPMPPVVSNLIMKLMAKSPADRYQSGAGIRADLEECLRRLKATGEIADFSPGRGDGTGRLVFPERLYGREDEMAGLRRVLEAGRRGGRRLVLVSGDPGIGKTSLVRRVMDGFRREVMRLITGKFRPVRENIPYSGIAECLVDLVRQVSAEGEATTWRRRIASPAPDLPELGPLETRNRLELAVTRFFNLFQSAETPLALFLDDLQWADEASIRLTAAPESPFAYAIYGLILCGACRRVARGYRFGRMALTLSERSDNDAVRTKTAMLYYGFIHPWKHPLRDSLPPLLATYRAGMENGDLEYAAWTLHIHSYHAYFSGRQLTHLAKEMADHETAIYRTGQKSASVAQSIYRQAVLNLLIPGPDPCRLEGDAYDEKRMLPRHRAAENTHAIFNVHFHKLILNTLFGRFRDALDQADKAEACLQSVTGLAAVYLFYFYRALAGYGLAASSEGALRRRWAGRAAAWQRKLTTWSRHAPMNFQHKYDLLTAERHRAAGRFQKAAEHYVLSVTGAWDNGYIQDEALAAERAGRFYMARGMRVPARTCLLEARRAYRRWGAEAKADALDREWRDLFAESGAAGEGGGTAPLPEIIQEAGAPEMAAVMAAAGALSGEMHLETLLKLIMEIVMKHSGARRGCLLIHRKGRLTLEAEAAIEPDRLRVLPGTDLSEVETVSRTIVEEVARTRTEQILRDAARGDRFGADPYVRRHRSRSVLALPLVHKDELTGVLYLENELAAGAFTADRVEMMRLFSSQAAVFIQNAFLYRQLAQSEEKYRSIFENAAEGIFRADESGRIIDINPAFFRMLGCPTREECLCWLADPAPTEAMGPEGLWRLLREQKPLERMEMEIRRRDGGAFQAAVSAARVRDSHENRYFYEGMVLDITAEKNRRSEEEAIAEERRRIAREIHDGVAQDLAFIRLRTAKWRRMIEEDPDRLNGEFDLLLDLLGKNIREVRRSIFALRPADLDELGFFPALGRFLEDFQEQMEIQVRFTVTGSRDDLPMSMELGLFRILQESLNNIAKHAGADIAWVALDILPSEIVLTVADNGCGFGSDAVGGGVHLGIQQMRERMHHFGGAFFLTHREGGGAQVQAVFPLKKELRRE